MRRIALTLAVLSVLLPLSSAELVSVPCRDWYEFGSVEFTGLAVDRPAYSPGDAVKITALARSNNSFPLVEGSVRAHIIYRDGVEEYIIDEFPLAEDVSMLPNGTVKATGEWQIPEGIKSGEYLAAVHFIVADSFNMAGVSFLRGIYGEVTSFDVEGGDSLVYFDTSSLTINGESVSLHSPSTAYNDSEAVNVRIPIVNEGPAEEVKITYELYSWDDLRGEDLLEAYTSEETLQLPAGSSRSLSYTIPASVPSGAYLLRATASSGKNDAILKVRIPVLGRMIKLNFAGLDTFPFTAGEPVKLFLCASNTAEPAVSLIPINGTEEAGAIQDAELKLSLEADGETIFTDFLRGAALSGAMQGYETEFTPQEVYRRVTLRVEATDEAGNVESYELAYDLDKLFEEVDISLDSSSEPGLVRSEVSLSRGDYPVSGKVNIYVKNSEGAVISLEQGLAVDGSYSKTFQLEPGTYLLKAVELTGWNSAEAEVEVPEAEEPPPETGEEPEVPEAEEPPPETGEEPEEGGDNLLILILLVVILIALFMYVKSRPRK